MYKKTRVLFFLLCNFTFSLMNDKDQGIPMWKSKVARNEKGKKLHGFSLFLYIRYSRF